MREPIAQLVHPVLAHGLQLQARLEAGERVELDQEQAVLKDLLLSDFESLRWREFGGDAASRGAHQLSPADGDGRHHDGDHFLGIRYLLVCWLDELFCSQSDWGVRWNERKLEVELYGTNDRAWKFWEQAAIARSRAGDDAVEVSYLCVALGFRGQLRNDPNRLQTWIQSAKRRLGKVEELGWQQATSLTAANHLQPLHGRHKLTTMALTAWIALLILVPVLSFTLIHRLGS